MSLALRLLTRFGDTLPVIRIWVRAMVDSTLRPEARRLAAKDSAPVLAMPGYRRAPFYAGLGLDDQAMTVLEAEADQRGIAPLGIKSTQFYDRLRRNPRMVALVAKMGLPAD